MSVCAVCCAVCLFFFLEEDCEERIRKKRERWKKGKEKENEREREREREVVTSRQFGPSSYIRDAVFGGGYGY